jgi:hypothetical protein
MANDDVPMIFRKEDNSALQITASLCFEVALASSRTRAAK